MIRYLPLALVLAALLACLDRPADRAADGEPPAALELAIIPDPVPCTVEGLRSCARSGEVLIGSQPTEEALATLAAEGYTTVVTTRADDEIDWDEQAVVESLGMRFVRIAMPSPVTDITDAQVMRLDSVLGSADGPVVLHCGSGNRVSGLWATWLAAERGFEPDEALRLAELAGMGSVRPAVERRLRPNSVAP
jgi:uncharacterized protein (TIGR01244 family)